MIEIVLNSQVLEYLKDGCVVIKNGATYYLNLHETIVERNNKFYSVTETKYLPHEVLKIYQDFLKKYV
jgi:glucosamine 6-phosphate synthetase-like amidotransferase/phosphosugar isomerase protein